MSSKKYSHTSSDFHAEFLHEIWEGRLIEKLIFVSFQIRCWMRSSECPQSGCDWVVRRMTRPSVMMITILILVGTLQLISASTIKGRICDWSGKGEEKSPGPSVTASHSIQFNEILCVYCSVGWELNHPSIWWIPPQLVSEKEIFSKLIPYPFYLP